MLSKIIMIFSFGNWGKWKESVSCSVVSDSFQPHGLSSSRLLCPWNSPGMNTGVGSHSLLQGIFPTEGSNPGLPHCGRILYFLSHQGSPWQHTCTLYWCCIILGLLSYDILKHLTWYHHQTIFKRTCVPLILMPMYWQSNVKKQKSLNVFITHTFHISR